MVRFKTYLKKILFSLLLIFWQSTFADQCTSVFPTGMQSITNGTLTFSDCGTQLLNNSTTALPFETISNPTSCATPTCQSANCSASNTYVNLLNVGSFQTSRNTGGNISVTTTTTLDSNNNTTTDYGTVTVNSGATLNFTPNSNGNTVYRMTQLNVKGGGTVNLQPGDYWIGTLSITAPSTASVFTVQGNGTARVFINNFPGNGGNGTNWNVGGAASKLLIYSYDTINLNGTCQFNALMYSTQSITFTNSITVTGAVTAQNITLKNTSKVTYDSTAASNMNFGPYVICSTTAASQYCNSVFPDGVQCSAPNCTTQFNQCANKIINNPGYILPSINTIVKKAGCSTYSCDTADCVASGTIGPTLDYGPFQATTSVGGNITVANGATVTLDGNNDSLTDYNDITVNNGGTLNFTPNPNGTTLYRIHTLTVHTGAVVNFQPGDYWINSFNLLDNPGGTINVVGTSGTARLHINNDFNPTNSQQMNVNGSASQLFLYTYHNINIDDPNAVINAVLYSVGNAVIKNSARVIGAISANGNVTFDGTATLTFDPAAVANMDFGSVCPRINPTRFKVDAPATGTNCQNLTIAVTAQDASGQTVSGYVGGMALSTQNGSGTWVSTGGRGIFEGNTSDGLASYQFSPTNQGVATFQLNYPASGASPITIRAFQTNNSTIAGVSNSINFIPTGFLVTSVPVANPPNPPPNAFSDTQIAGNNFNVNLTAYNPNNCGIITSYSGPKTIRLWTNYVNPASGTIRATMNGAAIANSAGATQTTQLITFTNGAAVVTGNYLDVGQLTLNVQDISTGGPAGMSGNFVVVPARFAINIPGNNASQTVSPADAAQSACLADTVFAKAGNAFTVNVQPQNAQGGATPNYGNESPAQGIVLQSSAIIAPANGANGSANDGKIANSTAFTKITNNAGPFTQAPYFTGSNFSFDEVGCINLTASVAGGSYLGTQNVISSVVVGRFTPDHFDASGNNPFLTTGCSVGANSFTYLDQPFTYAVSPTMTLTAKSLSGTTTQNYTGSFWRLANTALGNVYNKQYYPVNGTDVIPNLIFSAINPLPAFVDNGGGVGTFTFSDGGGFKIQRQSGTLVSPFTAEIQLKLATVIDSDGVFCTNGCTSKAFNFGATTAGAGIRFTGVGGGKQFYHGRMVLIDTVGSELLTLTMPMQTQYYTSGGNGFAINTLDSCTMLLGGVSNLILTPSSGITTTPSLSSNTFNQGNINISLTPPNASGYVDIEANITSTGANLPWLQFNWPYAGSTNGAFTADPRGHATFGVFKGNDRIIFEKEIFQ